MRSILSLLITLSIFVFGFKTNPKKDLGVIEVEKHINETLRNNSLMANDIHSILISKKGEVTYSKYFNQYTADSLNNLKSITKSIIGLLVGIAIEEGYVQNVQQPILDFFPECQSGTSKLDDKKTITIENLLLMQSGIEWNNRALVKDEWWFNENPHCFLLREFPMDTIPGVKFSYNSGAAHLLSGILSRSTGKTALDVASEHLFKPLNIKAIRWDRDQKGEYYGNSELFLRPDNLLLIGQVLLNNGVYQNKQIVPQHWIKKMQEKSYDATSLMNYGYLWMASKNDDPYFYFAGGSGGQHLFIVPEKEVVLVTTAHWDNARSTLEIMSLGRELIDRL